MNTAEPADPMTQAQESQRPVSTPVSSRTESTVVPVGTASQLLIDDYVVDDVWMIRRSPEMPVKHLENPIFNPPPPFENCATVAQSVMYDSEEKIFKLWYTVVDTNKDSLPEGRNLLLPRRICCFGRRTALGDAEIGHHPVSGIEGQQSIPERRHWLYLEGFSRYGPRSTVQDAHQACRFQSRSGVSHRSRRMAFTGTPTPANSPC